MYPVTVSNRGEFTRKQKRQLKRLGLIWDGYEFNGLLKREKKIEKIRSYCKAEKLNFKIKNSMGNRSANYRSKFFTHHSPNFLGSFYICAYCGKLLSKKNVTVDHLYPIGQVSRSVKYQKKLKKKGIQNINSAENLVPACERCNMKKGDKAGLWILRGKLGRHTSIWLIRWTMELLILAALIYVLIYRREEIANWFETFFLTDL